MSTLSGPRKPPLRGGAWRLMMLAAWALASALASAQSAGEVEFARGVGFAQAGEQTPRTLGKGLVLSVGDRLTTAEGAVVIIKLIDGTRMTLRPNTELVLQQYQFKESAPDNSMVLQMLRGGLRAITGLISKGSPDAAKIQTTTATIGIRGTDFDARLCAKDCSQEVAASDQEQRPNRVLASAKLVAMQGGFSAVNSGGEKRGLVAGASVYPGDTVQSDANAHAVLVFRDESRISIGPDSRLRLDDFVFDRKNAAEGRLQVTLLRGTLRALTGLVAQADPNHAVFFSAQPGLSIQGQGLDLSCLDGARCSLFNWLGMLRVTSQAQSETQVVDVGQGLIVGAEGAREIRTLALQDLLRPDSVNVDWRALFAETELDSAAQGLFVYVRDGHIEVSTERETLHLGRGEAGFAGINGGTARPLLLPLFLELDQMPMPNSTRPAAAFLLNGLGSKGAAQCN